MFQQVLLLVPLLGHLAPRKCPTKCSKTAPEVDISRICLSILVSILEEFPKSGNKPSFLPLWKFCKINLTFLFNHSLTNIIYYFYAKRRVKIISPIVFVNFLVSNTNYKTGLKSNSRRFLGQIFNKHQYDIVQFFESFEVEKHPL